jgi:hypothetical protein
MLPAQGPRTANPESRFGVGQPISQRVPDLSTARPAPERSLPFLGLPSELTADSAAPKDSATRRPISPKRYWTHLALGFGTSILAHEAGHFIASLAVGAHPHMGFDKGRPTVYSGINAETDPHKQFIFSSAGLNVQAILDEAILDIPHHRGAAFERGLLAGGIATAYFYATLGRNASNSDITYMARTSSLSKTQASLIYAGLATLHVIRIARNDHYAHFFIRPKLTGTPGTVVGVAIMPK